MTIFVAWSDQVSYIKNKLIFLFTDRLAMLMLYAFNALCIKGQLNLSSYSELYKVYNR